MKFSTAIASLATFVLMFSAVTVCNAQLIINSPFPQGNPGVQPGNVFPRPEAPGNPLIASFPPRQGQPQMFDRWGNPMQQPRQGQPQMFDRWGNPIQPQQQIWVDQWGNPIRPSQNSPIVHEQQTVKFKYDRWGNLVVDDTVELTRESALDPNRGHVDAGSMTSSSSVRMENGYEITETTYRWTSFGQPHHRTETNRRRFGEQGVKKTVDRGFVRPPRNDGNQAITKQ